MGVAEGAREPARSFSQRYMHLQCRLSTMKPVPGHYVFTRVAIRPHRHWRDGRFGMPQPFPPRPTAGRLRLRTLTTFSLVAGATFSVSHAPSRGAPPTTPPGTRPAAEPGAVKGARGQETPGG